MDFGFPAVSLAEEEFLVVLNVQLQLWAVFLWHFDLLNTQNWSKPEQEPIS